MTMSLDTATHQEGSRSVTKPILAPIAATSLTFLKPRLRKVVRPLAARLAAAGYTANQVTLASLAGSISVSVLLCAFPGSTALYAMPALWIPVRTTCAALDGTLAVEFGQKSRLGGILNEVGDIVSDAALILPVGLIEPFSPSIIAMLIVLIVLSELAGIAGPILGSDRRLEGPLGKADRSIVIAATGLVIAIDGGLPEGALSFIPIFVAGMILTIWNRLRFALADRGKTVS